jgi:hypothetical protein
MGKGRGGLRNGVYKSPLPTSSPSFPLLLELKKRSGTRVWCASPVVLQNEGLNIHVSCAESLLSIKGPLAAIMSVRLLEKFLDVLDFAEN